MTLEEIQQAVNDGKTVHWANENYVVLKGRTIQQWLVKCVSNGSCIGLTWADGKTMNGKPEDFYIKES